MLPTFSFSPLVSPVSWYVLPVASVSVKVSAAPVRQPSTVLPDLSDDLSDFDVWDLSGDCAGDGLFWANAQDDESRKTAAARKNFLIISPNARVVCNDDLDAKARARV